MVALAVAAAVFLSVVFPRLKGSKRGIIYFSGIAEYDTAAEYADDVTHRALPEFVRAKLRHSHELARVCRRKYRALLAGLWIGSVGAGAALLYFLVGGVG